MTKAVLGTIDLEVPRDRNGSFTPTMVPKGTSRLAGFNDKIIALYPRGMTVKDVQSHLREIYDVDVSADLISRVTDGIWDELETWRDRPLDPIYTIIYIDANAARTGGFGCLQSDRSPLFRSVRVPPDSWD